MVGLPLEMLLFISTVSVEQDTYLSTVESSQIFLTDATDDQQRWQRRPGRRDDIRDPEAQRDRRDGHGRRHGARTGNSIGQNCNE